MKRTIIAVLLLALLCACCGCGQTIPKTKGTKNAQDLQIGALFPDAASASSLAHYQLLGLQKTVEELKLPELVCKYSVTDVAFDPSAPVTATTAEPIETTAAPEPESYTTHDGEVIVRGVPVVQEKPESAVSATADLIEQGCTVIVASDPIYDDLTAFLAQKFSKVTFLQYRGTHTDLPNLQSYSDNVYEAFYLAGAVAGCEGVKRIGFTARTGSPDEKNCINAFALGAAKTNPGVKIDLCLTNTDFDLDRERTVPLELIRKYKCELLAQTVFTALPVSVAANIESKDKRDPLPSIGFGYDMQSDGGEKYLCSVVYDFSVYYIGTLNALKDGSFDAAPYTGGVREGVVGLSALQHASEKAESTVQSLTEAYQTKSLQPLKGFQPEFNGYAANVTVR